MEAQAARPGRRSPLSRQAALLPVGGPPRGGPVVHQTREGACARVRRHGGRAGRHVVVKRAAAKNLQAWANRLTPLTNADADERSAVQETLSSFGTVRNLLEELDVVRRENKKLRFREQRFAHEPLLADASTLLPRACCEACWRCRTNSRRPWRRSEGARQRAIRCSRLNYQDHRRRAVRRARSGRALRSGISGITSVRTSAVDLSARQRDIIEGGLRSRTAAATAGHAFAGVLVEFAGQRPVQDPGQPAPGQWVYHDRRRAPITNGATNSRPTVAFELEASVNSTVSSYAIDSSIGDTRATSLSMTSTLGNTSANAAIRTLKQRVQDCAVQIERHSRSSLCTQSEPAHRAHRQLTARD